MNKTIKKRTEQSPLFIVFFTLQNNTSYIVTVLSFFNILLSFYELPIVIITVEHCYLKL